MVPCLQSRRSCNPLNKRAMFRSPAIAFAFALAGCMPSASPNPTVVEASMPAVGPDGKLVQAVGIETLGGVFTPLLPRGCALPCSISQNFSTSENNQPHIDVYLYRGNCRLVPECQPLGRFRIAGFAGKPRGEPAVSVTFSINAAGITLAAHEAGQPLTFVRVSN